MEQSRLALHQGIAALEAEAATLTGKDNKKDRASKGKEVAELKAEPFLWLQPLCLRDVYLQSW